MKYKNIFFFVFLFILFRLCTGQQINFVFNTLDTESGLAQNTVNCILQDSRGFMWFGTEYGLSKYDGRKITNYTYNLTDSNSLGGYRVMDIEEDLSGNLWISTGNSLSFLESKNFGKGKFINYGLSTIFDLEISKKYPDSIIWVASQKGLMVFDKKNQVLKHLLNEAGQPITFNNNNILKLLEDKQGNLWIGTEHSGLFCLKDISTIHKQVIHFSNVFKYKSEKDYFGIFEISEDSGGNIWVGSNGGGLIKIPFGSFNEKNFAYYNSAAAEPNRIECDYITHSILEDKDGIIWFSSDGGGIGKLNPNLNKVEYIKNNPSNPKSISSSRIMSLFIDSSGLLWAGSKDMGVIRIINDFQYFMYFPIYLQNKAYTKKMNTNVWTIRKSRKNNFYWAGIDRGVCLLEKRDNTFSVISEYTFNTARDANLDNLQIRDIYEEESGRLWLASIGLGLISLNPESGSFKTWKHNEHDPESFPSNIIYSIEHTGDNLWLGMNNAGLTRFNLKTKRYEEFLLKDEPLGLYFVTTVRQSPLFQNALWLGEWNYGLIYFNQISENFQFYHRHCRETDSINKHSITAIFVDNDSTLWLGTYGGGLIKGKIINPNDENTVNPSLKFKSYTRSHGLGNEMIYGILKDNNGMLWMSTNTGLTRLNPKTEVFTNYSYDDGLPSKGFNLGACLKDKDFLYFGGGDGLYYFKPRYHENKNKPKVVLTSFSKFGKPVTDISLYKLRTLELSYTDNFFSFEFAALSYKNPEKNQYAYKMEGFDKHWVHIGNNNQAVYTNLDPGEYVFKVKAANSDGVWNNDALRIDLIINAPLWMRWWFYLALLILTAGIVYLLHRVFLKKAVKIQEKLQADLARNFHDDTGGYLANIRTISYNLINDSNKNKPKMLSRIAEQSEKLSNAIKDLLFEMDPYKAPLTDLVIFLKDHSDALFENTSIAFEVIGLRDEFDKIQLTPKWRANLLRIFKEGLNNIIKHSPDCKNVSLQIAVKNRILFMRLKDDGQGFELSAPKNGNGLKNLENRARELNGEIAINSKSGFGTEITFKGKLPFWPVDLHI